MRTDDRVMAAARIAALGTGGAAAIHLAVAGEHFQEWWLFGTFFLVLSVAQGLLGWRLWVAPTVRLAAATGALNLATVGLWALTRTSGLPFGPAAGEPEPWGVTDGICAGLELLAAAACTALVLWVRRNGAVPTGWSASRAAGLVVSTVAALVVLASGIAVAAPGEHSDTGDHADEAMADMADMAGDPASGGSAHGNGERHEMANLPDVSRATAAQTAAGRRLVTTLESDTAEYRDPAAATSAGYDIAGALSKWSKKHDGKQPGQIAALHVPQPQARTDDKLVDPSAPETLIYHRTEDGGLTLIGVMFTAQGQQPPARFQPYMRWHYHHMCIGRGGERTRPPGGDENAACPSGTRSHTSGYMTHVWLVEPGSSADQLRYAFAMAPPTQQLQQALAGAA
ncbi:hypothetical protein ACPPVT_08675 [Angustibacter sp. McL0619]|uniref:hypothetical protein n=1 Tax=Angustibacter sp. McL0619 TaxID=3415676 RepID=UPI003CF7513D